jgi:hypothetical protein
MKAEVYSWRLSSDLKSDLEQEARRRKLSLSAALDLAAREWLTKARSGAEGDEEEQRRLQESASSLLGAFTGGDPDRSRNAREAVQKCLREKHVR